MEEVFMKWMDSPSVGPSVTEMNRGGVYEMDKQKKCQQIEMLLKCIQFETIF